MTTTTIIDTVNFLCATENAPLLVQEEELIILDRLDELELILVAWVKVLKVRNNVILSTFR